MFGELVRGHRRRLGLTQEELAAATGISVRSVGKIEAGLIAAPRSATVRLLADAFGLTGEDRECFRRAATGDAFGQPDRVPAQLPADVPGFTGREAELGHLDAALMSGSAAQAAQADPAAPAIAMVSGMAGAGKSALAIHWAHRAAPQFPDGQLYVNLRGFDPSGQMTDPSEALRGFLAALGVPPERIPVGVDAQAALYRSVIAGKRVLVVADNARSAQHVRPLLPGTPAVAVLVTSRDQLTGLVAVDGARPVTVGPLATAQAHELLARRLGADRVDAEPGAVRQLIAACARLPLALVIVAARAQQARYPLATLAAELSEADQRLDMLDAGEAASQVRAVFSWSYTALTPPAARLFRLLGLHPCPDISTAAAASLAGLPQSRARRILAELVTANLLTEHARGRYACHDLLRAYAGEQADVHETELERHAALGAMFGHYLAGAAAAMDALFPAEKHRRPDISESVGPAPPVATPAAARSWLDGERASLVAVTAHAAAVGWPGHAVLLAPTLYRYLVTGGHYSDGRAVFAAALDVARQTGGLAAEADSLMRCGVFDFELGLCQEAAAAFRAALQAYQATGDRLGQARALNELGMLDAWQDRVEQAATQLRQALALSREIGDRLSSAQTLTNLGFVMMRQGHYERATGCENESLAIYRELGDRLGEAATLDILSEILCRQGHYQRAEDHGGPALAIFRELGCRSGEASALQNLGHACREQAKPERAAELQRQALAICRESGERLYIAGALNSLGETLSRGGLPAQASAHHRQALALADEIGARYEQARAYDGLAHACSVVGELDQAGQYWQQALTAYTSLGAPESTDVRTRLKDLAAM